MKKMLVLSLCMLALVGLSSCDNDDSSGTNFEFRALKVTDAELPDSFQLGRTYEIVVTYERPDACTYFQGFDVYPEDTAVREVTAIGWEDVDRACTQQIIEGTNSFLFRVIHEKDYTFRFWQSENADGEPQYLEMTVPIDTTSS
ncbi:hypothetical protein RQM65_02745 [Pricia sp. S334]|uniref:Proteinase inhibitor I42 chagasin domain-containing protein n=1 Tax=Pricia mediterranea TaxID=3076079 RepID=A0ABU3L2E7_9FLAO|nr:hypothetical protein [Pricia sp. S334]MDT7827582.1 hypothetical protein [Pricia sp. S334]